MINFLVCCNFTISKSLEKKGDMRKYEQVIRTAGHADLENVWVVIVPVDSYTTICEISPS
jgi:hypothetical protein